MKKVMITGGSSGLGLELAKVYGRNGFEVLLVGRGGEALQGAVNVLNQLGVSGVRVYSCDVRLSNDVKNLAKQIKLEHGSVERIINCAGIGVFGPFETLSVDDMRNMMDVNYFGTAFVVQAFQDIVTERIINIISTAGLRGKRNETAYCASKFAVRGFTESLQVEWAGRDVKVTAVYMGGMDTPFWSGSTHIEDKSALRDPESVALTIYSSDDGRAEIHIE